MYGRATQKESRPVNNIVDGGRAEYAPAQIHRTPLHGNAQPVCPPHRSQNTDWLLKKGEFGAGVCGKSDPGFSRASFLRQQQQGLKKLEPLLL